VFYVLEGKVFTKKAKVRRAVYYTFEQHTIFGQSTVVFFNMVNHVSALFKELVRFISLGSRGDVICQFISIKDKVGF